MRPIFGIPRPAANHPVLRSLAILVLAPFWIQSLALHVLAANPQSTYSPITRSARRKPDELGVWHHFGATPAAPSPAPRSTGVWRHFGDGGNVPIPEPGLSPRARGVNRMHDLELEMLEMVNRDRVDPANAAETNGRANPLQWNDGLAAVARAHSIDMLSQGYFAHQDGQGRNVSERVRASGMEWQSVGENIAIYNTVASAEAAFMNEPRFTQNHRANILNVSFTELGIGIVQATNGSFYITQDFYTPLGSR